MQWLYGPMREYPGRPGNALRPALCLSAGRVFGAGSEALLGIAEEIELLHNAFLIRDDIADGSEMRRGRPTLAAEHGMAAALNAGDGLAIVAGQVLRRATHRLDRDLADRVLVEFDIMAMRTLEGQATEIGWQRDNTANLSPASMPRASCWWPKTTSKRPSPMRARGPTSTSCGHWCRMCGPAGTDLWIDEHRARHRLPTLAR